MNFSSHFRPSSSLPAVCICRVTACLSTDRGVFARRARHYLLSLACHPLATMQTRQTLTLQARVRPDLILFVSRKFEKAAEVTRRSSIIRVRLAQPASRFACIESPASRDIQREKTKKGKKESSIAVADKFSQKKSAGYRDSNESQVSFGGIGPQARTNFTVENVVLSLRISGDYLSVIGWPSARYL